MHLKKILLPDLQPLPERKFVSVAATYEAMSRLSEERLAYVSKKYSSETSQRLAHPSLSSIDPIVIILLDYFVIEAVDLFVGEPMDQTCRRISPQVLRHGAAGFDLPMSVRLGVFLIIEKCMPHSSLEVRYAGYPMWTRASDIVALMPQHVSDADIRRTGDEIINELIAAGGLPKLPDVRTKIMNRVKANSGIEPSLDRVDEITKRMFPAEWSRRGPKGGRKKS